MCIGGDMPFPGHIGLVSGFGEELWPEHLVLGFRAEFGVYGLSVPYVATGDEHRAACDANCGAPRAHVVASTEGGPACGESIKVWGVDVGVTEGSNGLVGEIVSEEKKDVWFFWGGLDTR